MLTAKDLILSHCQAQAVLLPYDFFLVDVFSKDSWEHHNNLGVLEFNL